MSEPRLNQTFNIAVRGIQLPEPIQFNIPKIRLTATLEPGDPLVLNVAVEGTDQGTAEGYAARFVQELYLRLLLRFGAHISETNTPNRIRQQFTAGDGSSSSVSLAHSADAYIARASVCVKKDELDNLAHGVEMRVITPQVVTSADLYTAQGMYVTGLGATNQVVRFVVLYSALALAALFRFHSGNQRRVDELLLVINPRLPQSPHPSWPNRTETLYTKVRNDLIHGEERGHNPANAIAAIEANILDFQRDVALVMSSL